MLASQEGLCSVERVNNTITSGSIPKKNGVELTPKTQFAQAYVGYKLQPINYEKSLGNMIGAGICF